MVLNYPWPWPRALSFGGHGLMVLQAATSCLAGERSADDHRAFVVFPGMRCSCHRHRALLTGAGMAWVLDFWDTQLLAQNMVAGVDSFPLLAVPFFVLAGELMNAGGISKRIIDMAQAWVGHVRGGLGYVAIGAAILLSAMSGSALADAAAMSAILLPMMRQHGYPVATSAGLIASGSVIGPIIPPSMAFVIYASPPTPRSRRCSSPASCPAHGRGAGGHPKLLLRAWTWRATRRCR